jgi:hypothetical protein
MGFAETHRPRAKKRAEAATPRPLVTLEILLSPVTASQPLAALYPTFFDAENLEVSLICRTAQW